MASQIDHLQTALAAEAAALVGFIDLLKEEKDALLKGSPDDIQALTVRKNVMVAQLNQAGRTRDEALSALGVTSQTRSAVEEYIQSSAPGLASAWRSLLELAQTAQQANQTNASIVSSRLQQTQEALSVVLQASGGDDSQGVYGPDGHKQSTGNRRPLGSA